MTSTDEQIAETTMAAAAETAKKLGMRRKNDLTSLRFGQPVMLVTEDGITTGSIRSTHGREDGYRYDVYLLEDTKLCSYTFNRLPGSTEEAAFSEIPIVETSLPKGAVLYAGRVPKDSLKSNRKSSYRY